MYLPVEPGRLIGGRKIEDALFFVYNVGIISRAKCMKDNKIELNVTHKQ